MSGDTRLFGNDTTGDGGRDAAITVVVEPYDDLFMHLTLRSCGSQFDTLLSVHDENGTVLCVSIVCVCVYVCVCV